MNLVWQDICDEEAVIPFYQGHVICKVVRVQEALPRKVKKVEKIPDPIPVQVQVEVENLLGPDHTPEPTPPTSPAQNSPSLNDDLVGLMDDPLPIPVHSPIQQQNPPQVSEIIKI